jgi:hypothetical protein
MGNRCKGMRIAGHTLYESNTQRQSFKLTEVDCVIGLSGRQCMIEEDWGQVLWADNQQLMSYNVSKMKNRFFIATYEMLKKRVLV